MERDKTNLGKFLDNHDISIREFSLKSGVNESTMKQLCIEPSHFPRSKTIRRVMDVVRRIEPEAQISDFFYISIQ